MQLRLTYVMNSLAARVRAARKFRGLTQAQLATQSGANQSDISKIERGDIERTTHLIGIALALQCDPKWLDTGDGISPWASDAYENPYTKTANKNKMDASIGNTKPSNIAYIDRRYPLLSSVQAGSWGIVDPTPGEVDDYVLCPVDLGPEGFCMKVDGDSMTCNDGPFSFPEGMNVCFQATPDAKHKDFVCVVREGEGNAIFKQLLHIDGQWFLHSLNPLWPTKYIPIQQGDRITGRLKYAGWQF